MNQRDDKDARQKLSHLFACEDKPSSQQVDAFFDGELKGTAQERFLRRLEAGDTTLRDELSSLRTVGLETRSWLRGKLSDPDGALRRVDLWERIEQGIVVADAEAESMKARRLSRWASLKDYLQPRPFYWPQLATGLALGTVIVLISGIRRDTEAGLEHAVSNEPTVTAARTLEPAEVSGQNYVLPMTFAHDVELVSSSQCAVHPTAAGEPANNHRDLPPAEIEWIKTNRPFRIVSTSESTPPVIWVANRAD